MKRSDIPTVDVLRACDLWSKRFMFTPKESFSPFEILLDKHGNYPKVVIAAMRRDEKSGLIDYGTTLLRSWPTNKGKEFLKDINF